MSQSILLLPPSWSKITPGTWPPRTATTIASAP